MATVRAVEPMHVLKVYVYDFRCRLLDRPQIALSMLRALALRLRGRATHRCLDGLVKAGYHDERAIVTWGGAVSSRWSRDAWRRERT
jgi:CRP-like cAMP-binding protein